MVMNPRFREGGEYWTEGAQPTKLGWLCLFKCSLEVGKPFCILLRLFIHALIHGISHRTPIAMLKQTSYHVPVPSISYRTTNPLIDSSISSGLTTLPLPSLWPHQCLYSQIPSHRLTRLRLIPSSPM